MEKPFNLIVTKFSYSKFLKDVERGVINGYPLLIEDVDETVDPALEAILSKAFYDAEGRTLIRFADKEIDYHAEFRMFLVTKKPNPSYLPEVFIKVNVINFTATFDGLED